MAAASPKAARVVVEPIDLRVSSDSVVVSFAGATGPAILESSLQVGPYGRFSIFACNPVEVFAIDRPGSMCLLGALAERVAAYPPVNDPSSSLPFIGGWIGFLSYEAGLAISESVFEKPVQTQPKGSQGCRRRLAGRSLPLSNGALAASCLRHPNPLKDPLLPLARFCLYDAAAVYDHLAGQWYLTAVEWGGPPGRRQPPVAVRLAALRQRLEAAAALDIAEPPALPLVCGPLPNMSYETYLAKVERAKGYIEAGDIYQVNLTQRFTARTEADPLSLYRRLRRASPSPHAAFLLWDGAAILSSSPELFLELRDGRVVTRPIKGTRPRIGDPRADAAYRCELAQSEKDRAELTMIVDLLRNDLGRVCSFGTVRVTCAGEIEEHPTVFHRVATIEGDLEPGCDWVDLLRAAFPGGSVTGAPKIRAMQIIDELEPTPRGVYCGSIGLIGLDGSMSLNIAIRTMVQTGDVVHLYSGGAIVADSTPEEEYHEIIAKSAGMLRALGCEAPAGCPVLSEYRTRPKREREGEGGMRPAWVGAPPHPAVGERLRPPPLEKAGRPCRRARHALRRS